MHHNDLALFSSRLSLLRCLLAARHEMQAHGTCDRPFAETTANVPELKAFHHVIYQIWHGAWPKKDTEQLAALLPEVEAGVKSVAEAKLPGILRERKAAWEENVAVLQVAAWDYRRRRGGQGPAGTPGCRREPSYPVRAILSA